MSFLSSTASVQLLSFSSGDKLKVCEAQTDGLAVRAAVAFTEVLSSAWITETKKARASIDATRVNLIILPLERVKYSAAEHGHGLVCQFMGTFQSLVHTSTLDLVEVRRSFRFSWRLKGFQPDR